MFTLLLETLDQYLRTPNTSQHPAFQIPELLRLKKIITSLNNTATKNYELDQQAANQAEQLAKLSDGQVHRTQFFGLTKELLQAVQLKNARPWRTAKQEELAKPASWWGYAAQAVNHLDKLETLEKNWQLHGRYADFSTPDLIGVYWRHVGEISQWLKNVKSALQPDEQKALRKELQHEKRAIRAGLLARVAAGIQTGDLRFDDVLVATTQNLMQLDAMSVKKLPKGTHRQMTPSTLRYIQQIIGVDGSKTEKAQLAALLYPPIRTNTSVVIRKNHFGITFAIPAAAKQLIAEEPPFYTKLPRWKWLQTLFRGEKALYQFFQHPDCQYLLVAQQHLAKQVLEKDLTATQLRHSPAWNYYQDLMQLLGREEKRRSEKLRTFSGFLQEDMQAVLKHYQASLSVFAKQLFHKQLEVFEKLVQVAELQTQTRILNDAETFELEDVMQQLTTLRQQWKIAASVQWQTLNNRYQNLLQAFSSIARQAKPTYEQTNTVLQQRLIYAQSETVLTAELAKSPLTMTAPVLVEHIQVLKQQMHTVTYISDELQTNLYRYIQNLVAAIQNLPGRSAFTKLEGHVQLILKTYLEWPLDRVLREQITSLQNDIQQYRTFDWHLFQKLAITPRSYAFEATTVMSSCTLSN